MSIKLSAELEIDHDRGVIYVHLTDPKDVKRFKCVTALRICRLPKPIPANTGLDITGYQHISWVEDDTEIPPKLGEEQILAARDALLETQILHPRE